MATWEDIFTSNNPAGGRMINVQSGVAGTDATPYTSDNPAGGRCINVNLVGGGVGTGFLQVAGGVISAALAQVEDNSASPVGSILYLSTINVEIRGTGVSTFSLNNGTNKVSFDYSGITGSNKILTIPNTSGTIALTSDIPTSSGLLKLAAPLDGTLRTVLDYAGTSSLLQLSTSRVSITGMTLGSVLFVGASSSITQDNSNFFWDNTNKFFGVGTPVPTSEVFVYSTSTAADRGISFRQDSSDGLGARINSIKSRANGIITSGDVLGRWAGWGYDSTGNKILMAQISMTSTGTIALGRIPTKMIFSTATDAASSVLTTALTLDSDQSASFTSNVKFTAADGTSYIQSAWQSATPAGVASNTTMWFDSTGRINWRLGTGGTSFIRTFDATGITANRTYTLPDASSTLAVLGLNQSFTGTQTFSVVALSGGQALYTSSGATVLQSNHAQTTAGTSIAFQSGLPITLTSGNRIGFEFFESFAPTSGTGTFDAIVFDGTINQTGGASGTSRGIYINPTFTTQPADFRGIEIAKGSVSFPYVAKTATYSILNNDYTIDCTSGTFTATLPTAVGCSGRIYVIKNSGTGVITIATTSAQTIDGASTQVLNTQYSSYTVQSNNANWVII